MRIVWRKFLISVLILFCVSIKFFSSAINVPASHETDALTFHTLFLNFTVKKRLFKWPVKVTGLDLIIIKRLLGSGDIEMNPGPTVNFKKFSQEVLKAPKNTKFSMPIAIVSYRKKNKYRSSWMAYNSIRIIRNLVERI